MIRFDNWNIQADGEILARQFDNLTRTLTVAGDIPAGWEWAMLVQVGDAMDIIPLTTTEGALRVVLTAEQVSIAGFYRMQLRATQGDLVRHTNKLEGIYIPPSLSGDKQWPVLPTEFSEMEQRVKANADRAENAAKRAEAAVGGGGGGVGAPGGYYSPEVTQTAPDTLQMSFTPSEDNMPAVDPVRVTLPAGPAGADGKDGYTPRRGVDYYTDADKTELVASVLAALPVYNGEVEDV